MSNRNNVTVLNAQGQTYHDARKRMMRISLALLATLGIALACMAISPAHAQRAALPDFSELVDKESAAVVNVSTKARPQQRGAGMNPDDNDQMLEFFRRFMPPEALPQPRQDPRNPRRQPRPPQNDAPLRDLGQGSGFFISSDGYIITNAHVIADAEEVKVTLQDGRELKARVVGSDASLFSDIAVLKVEGTNFPKVNIGNSDRLKVGEWVLAIGSPFGFENTVTAGIVSAKQRETGQYAALIQTDAAVNPGNSGGPLFNTKGEVVGVNSQIYTGTGGYLGISFAVPVNLAMDIANQLIKTGKVQRSRIGIAFTPAPITEELAEALGLPKKDPGIMVETVEKGGPAEAAGIKARDIIQKVDGKPVKSTAEVQRIIFPKPPGSKVPVTVWRDGKTLELTTGVRTARDDEFQTPRANTPPRQDRPDTKPAEKPNRLGLVVEALDDDDKKELSITTGVMIVDATGPAGRAGLRAGDAILMVNTTEVQSVAQFKELVDKLDDKRNVALLVKRGEAPPRYITMRPEAK